MPKIIALAGVVFLALGGVAQAGGPPKPPAPLNPGVTYEPYPDTDISQIVFKTSRQEFRTGHAPFKPLKFHAAEFTLVAEHMRKYLRPDFKAELQMAPARLRGTPELMAEKNFQAKWKSLITAYGKVLSDVKAVKFPAPSKPASEIYRAAFEDDQFLGQTIAKRMFASQDIRARELVREDLRPRFRATDAEWFDRLCDDFEKDANLSNFLPRFIDQFIEPKFKKAKEESEKAMQAAGVDYATAVADDKDIENQ